MFIGQGEDHGLMGWVLAGLASIVATLSTVIATLFKLNQTNIQLAHTREIESLSMRLAQIEAKNQELLNKADECITDREKLRVELATIKTRLELIENKTA